MAMLLQYESDMQNCASLPLNVTVNGAPAVWHCRIPPAKRFLRADAPTAIARGSWKYQLCWNGKVYSVAAPRFAFMCQNPQLSNDIHGHSRSHLCHHSDCANPWHCVLETLAVNQSRSGCPGSADGCAHLPLCVIPGPQFIGHIVAAVPYNDRVNRQAAAAVAIRDANPVAPFVHGP